MHLYNLCDIRHIVMAKILILFHFLSIFSSPVINTREHQDYEFYHQQVIKAETLIASENYTEALFLYEQLISDYDFIFLREYQIASQLALYTKNIQKSLEYVKQGILSGWEIKSIKKNKYLTPLFKDEAWRSIEKEYPNLHSQYESKLNQNIRQQVNKMYAKDQKKALKALFRLSSKSQDKYAENKFAPHSEHQMAEFSAILESNGYPGEKLIGNSTWMSTILSHHNSISTDYNKKDTLYPGLQPRLIDALKKGQMSPYEYVAVDDWYRTVRYDRKEVTYGVLDPPSSSDLSKTNELREKIFVRPYELTDQLMAIEEKTGMSLYLSDRWY